MCADTNHENSIEVGMIKSSVFTRLNGTLPISIPIWYSCSPRPPLPIGVKQKNESQHG